MKRIVISIVIIGLIIALGVFSLIYTSNLTREISDNLEQVRKEFLSGDIEAARAAAERANSHWKSFCDIHFLTSDSEHTLEITMTAKRIESLLEREDEEALTECEVMKELVRVYGDEQVPNIMNIL